MRLKKPRYTRCYRDRHGRLRFEYRKGRQLVALPGLPWSPEFMAAYERAAAGVTAVPIGAGRIKAGTIKDLVNRYFNSLAFAGLAAATKRQRRNILEKFVDEHGDKRVALLSRKHIEAMFKEKTSKRFAARHWLKAVKALLRFALSDGLISEDPTISIRNISGKTDGYKSWDENHIAAFEAKHALGTRERLAMSLLLFTGQRRGDVVRMGRQHVRNGAIAVKQQKTGAELMIPLHPDLVLAIDAMPSSDRHLTFLVTGSGKGFTPPGFGNWFREACNAAGLPKGLSAHGLRKAAARRLAEAGCSANVIASITGHATLAEVQRYTKAADQARMARDAMATLISQKEKRTGSVEP